MSWPARDELERRMHALVADHLDELEKRNPEGFNLGVQVFISEVLVPVESTQLLREDAGYTQARWRVWTSEVGGVTTAALVREVHEAYEDARMVQEYETDGDEDEDEDENEEIEHDEVEDEEDA